MPETVFTDERVELNLEVSEMVEDISQVVRLDRTRVQEMLDEYEDDKPQFPILRVTAGTVSGNGNHWPDAILSSVAEQVNAEERPGYWGHVKPEDRGYVFPDPETLWLGATVKKEKGKDVLYVKGYNIPGSRARRHRRLAKVTSWAGKASGRIVNGVRQIESFALESIDWARPGGSAGMDARVVAFATEMEGGDNEVAEGVDLAKVTVAELKAANPSLFQLVKQDVMSEQDVTEMKAKADKADVAETLFTKLRKLLNIKPEDDIEQAVVSMVEKVENLGSATLREKVAAILSKKFEGDDNAKARQTVMRLLPVTEMEGMTDDEIEAKVGSALDEDEDVKAVVTEMIQAPAPLTRHRREGSKSKVGQSGSVRETVRKF